jgi:rhodanese-related sulfurtransferase
MTLSFEAVRQALLARQEIALVDVREEDPFAQEHPLWAANFPLSRLELDIWRRIPRRDTLIAVYGEFDGEDLAPLALARLRALGYTQAHALEGGLEGWRRAGGELFRDVNVPSKSFGELVEAERHTPSLPAEEVQALLDVEADVVVLDARRFDEYQTMNIPGSISVPGAELVLRARALAPDPATRIIVNCAGRTRSIIGTQSLVNAGIPNPVAALRNGTIGWTLAGQTLEQGASRRFGDVDEATRELARADARAVAERAGVTRIPLEQVDALDVPGRALYRLDVRTPEEYAAGHLPRFASAPGGQLVQETDHTVPVRGARMVLADDDGVRADMTASWLAQMGWEVYVLEPQDAATLTERGNPQTRQPDVPRATLVNPQQLQSWLAYADGETQVLDVGPGMQYMRRHILGAWYAIRAQLRQALENELPDAERYVLTADTEELARFAAADLSDALSILGRKANVWVLEGGNASWFATNLPVERGESRLANPRTDRYRRPYEGTDNAHAAMQAYLDWEFGLVEQLRRDGTHHFKVI